MKLFKKVKEIRSKTGELHFKRFAIIETRWFAVYIHKIYKADKDPFVHNHPWNFFSIVLWGGYYEDTQWGSGGARDVFNINWGNRKYFHKIAAIIWPTTTLFCTFGKKKPWGFLTNQGYVDSEEYIKNKEKYNK